MRNKILPIAASVGVADYFQLYFFIRLALQTVIQVKDESRIFRFRKSITMNSRPPGSGQFGLHFIAIQKYCRIITGLGRLVLMRESGSIKPSADTSMLFTVSRIIDT